MRAASWRSGCTTTPASQKRGYEVVARGEQVKAFQSNTQKINTAQWFIRGQVLDCGAGASG
jgi:hypothetical protein